MTTAKIIADSISPLGDRLTTMELSYPRFIHGELMTHRVFSRNAASSRAIPTAKLIEQVRMNPAMPVEWGSNQPGMQAGPELQGWSKGECVAHWKHAAVRAADAAEGMLMNGAHKQLANRLLEPFMWMKTIVSSTEWDNFFQQRISQHSQPEMCQLAIFMRDALRESEPEQVGPEEWHLPYADDATTWINRPNETRKVSVARCARVSYLNHDGTRDVQKDLDLYERLKRDGHWSPFEHVATPAAKTECGTGNFWGWNQLRHLPEYQ